MARYTSKSEASGFQQMRLRRHRAAHSLTSQVLGPAALRETCRASARIRETSLVGSTRATGSSLPANASFRGWLRALPRCPWWTNRETHLPEVLQGIPRPLLLIDELETVLALLTYFRQSTTTKTKRQGNAIPLPVNYGCAAEGCTRCGSAASLGTPRAGFAYRK